MGTHYIQVRYKISTINHQLIIPTLIRTRYEHWTTPEYYQQVQENAEQQRRNQLKSEQLERRREKLRTFLDEEKKQHEQQLKG